MANVFMGVPQLQGPPDISNVLQMLSEGLQMRRERQADLAKTQLAQTIGSKLAGGDYMGAEGLAFGSGDIGTGLKVHELSLEGQRQFADTVQRYTAVADTPEKWDALRQKLTQLTGQDPGDFETGRPALQAEFGDLDKILQQNNQVADNARADEALQLQRERNDIARQAADAPPKAQAGYRYREDGTLEPIPGGPADPATIAEQTKARTANQPPRSRVLPQNAISAIGDAGSSYQDLSRVKSTFKDDYGGFMGMGAAALAAGRYLGLGNVDAAKWWQDYQNQKNVIRNKLFGSALTATEKAEFDRANIDPNMDPDVIRTNLNRQQMLAERAARKIANVYVQQGYGRNVIEAAIGFPLDELGLPEDLTAAPADTPQYDENNPPPAPPGVDPDEWPGIWKMMDEQDRQLWQ